MCPRASRWGGATPSQSLSQKDCNGAAGNPRWHKHHEVLQSPPGGEAEGAEGAEAVRSARTVVPLRKLTLDQDRRR